MDGDGTITTKVKKGTQGPLVNQGLRDLGKPGTREPLVNQGLRNP